MEIIEKINSVSDGFFHIGVVIPVLGESEFLWKTLQSLAEAQKNFDKQALILLVFNFVIHFYVNFYSSLAMQENIYN